MLIDDLQTIGNRFLLFRKRAGLTQGEVAERAGLSDRTYADIERGTVNMRLSTILCICNVFHVSPNDILTADDELPMSASRKPSINSKPFPKPNAKQHSTS